MHEHLLCEPVDKIFVLFTSFFIGNMLWYTLMTYLNFITFSAGQVLLNML